MVYGVVLAHIKQLTKTQAMEKPFVFKISSREYKNTIKGTHYRVIYLSSVKSNQMIKRLLLSFSESTPEGTHFT